MGENAVKVEAKNDTVKMGMGGVLRPHPIVGLREDRDFIWDIIHSVSPTSYRSPKNSFFLDLENSSTELRSRSFSN